MGSSAPWSSSKVLLDIGISIFNPSYWVSLFSRYLLDLLALIGGIYDFFSPFLGFLIFSGT